MKSFIRKYFGFSESETNGFIILIPLMALLLFIPHISKKILLLQQDEVNAQDAELLKAWMAELDSSLVREKQKTKTFEMFRFDPNRSSISDLTKLGFSEKTAKRIKKYRQAGGQFHTKHDLLKIYGISAERVEQLSDYLVFPKKNKPKPKQQKQQSVANRKPTPTQKTYNFELNTVIADSLVKIPGIGPYFSKSIVQYRDKLGGFVNASQLLEIYRLDEKVLDKLVKNTTLDTTIIDPLNVNIDSIKALARHPYISYRLAKVIVAYRQQHGAFQEKEALKKIRLMSDSIFNKIKPYINVDNI